MTERTIWVFVQEAPNAAPDLISRAPPPCWSYLERPWQTPIDILLAVPLIFPAASCPPRA